MYQDLRTVPAATDVAPSMSRSSLPNLAARLLAAAAAAPLFVGCAIDNYSFPKKGDASELARVERLVGDLAAETQEGGEDSLFDFLFIPLVHTDVHVFAEEDDPNYPGEHVEVDVDLYLPLGAFADARITRYDENREVYESQQYDSYFWGLYSVQRERIATPRGVRKHTRRRLLWFIPIGGAPRYVND